MPAAATEQLLRKDDLVRRTPRTVTDAHRLVAHLASVAQHGYAMDDEEHQTGVRSIAVPVSDPLDRMALSVSGRPSDLPAEHLASIVELLRSAAAMVADYVRPASRARS